MYFMTMERKEKRISRTQDMLKVLRDRLEATSIRINILEKELAEAYEGDIIEPMLIKAGIISRKDPSNQE